MSVVSGAILIDSRKSCFHFGKAGSFIIVQLTKSSQNENLASAHIVKIWDTIYKAIITRC